MSQSSGASERVCRLLRSGDDLGSFAYATPSALHTACACRIIKAEKKLLKRV